jgi:uncharacterized protein (DUF736 family)
MRHGLEAGLARRPDYLSVKLDDPSFPAPVYASLLKGETGEHRPIWR